VENLDGGADRERENAEVYKPISEKFEITAYCPCLKCCGKTDGITATGTKATEGRTIAVDPSKIPYGTEVLIDGKIYVAEDCGGAIKGNRIDLYFNNHQSALEWGRQEKEVIICG
jgi:3D (Asp-Asp-Asp) domain-containing protein